MDLTRCVELDPVRFDHGAAQRAAATHRAAARQLDELIGMREDASRRALRSWWGPHVDRFMTDEGRIADELRAMVDDLRRTALDVEAAAARARAEQARRDRHNAEVRAQRAAGQSGLCPTSIVLPR